MEHLNHNTPHSYQPQPIPAGIPPTRHTNPVSAPHFVGQQQQGMAPPEISYSMVATRMPAQYEVPEEHRHPYGRPPGDIRGAGYFYSVGAFTTAIGAFIFAGIQNILILAYATDYGYWPYKTTTVFNGLLTNILPAIIATVLGICAFTANGKAKTARTGRMTVFASLALVLGIITIFGVVGIGIIYIFSASSSWSGY